VQPIGEARPAWKVLRVLGNLLGLAGFDYDSADEVKRDAAGTAEVATKLGNRIDATALDVIGAPPGERLERIGEVPIYSADPLVRRAPSLQMTREAAPPVAWVSGVLYERLGLRPGDALRVRQEGGEAIVPVAIDERLPQGCIRLAAARPETAQLGAMFGSVTVERVAGQQKVAV